MFPRKLAPRAEALLSFIAGQWEITPEGGLSTTNHGVILLEQILIQTVQANTRLETIEVARCASTAIRDVVKGGNATLLYLEERFKELVTEAEASELAEYHLVTRCHFGLSVGQDFEVKIRNAAARFTVARPAYDLSEFFAGVAGNVNLDQPFGGAYAVLPVRARSSEAALHVGSKNIDLLFGALTFALEFGSLSSLPNPGIPIARAFPGKEIGLFRPDGSRCDDYTLFFPTVPACVFRTALDIPARWERVRSVVWTTRKSQLQYYEDFWRLYFHALAEPDVEGRVIRLWKVVEYVTFSNSEDEACRRIAAPFGPEAREIVALVFDALRMRRNWIAHNAGVGIHQDGVFELARDAVERFMWRSASKEFPRVQDWRAFLELSQGKHTPEQLELAAELIKRRDAPSDAE